MNTYDCANDGVFINVINDCFRDNILISGTHENVALRIPQPFQVIL